MKFVKIEEFKEKSRICEKILRSLPKWFGIEAAILDYIKAVAEMETWAAVESDVIGFISLKKHNTQTAEVHVMGLLPEFHGQKIGSGLIKVAEESLASEGFKFLTVKTLSEFCSDANYDKTRKFYLGSGFVPIEEFKTLWGEHNPCLMMIKNLQLMAEKIFVNHLMIGSAKPEVTVKFYEELLGFKRTDDDPGAIGGAVLTNNGVELLIIPFQNERLPNPAHFAFEVDSKTKFDSILEKAIGMNIIPRTWPQKDSKPGTSIFKRGSYTYELFYVFDPSGVNLEVMVKV